MISPETRAEICRLVKGEHFTITKTAKILGIHHSTVRHAIDGEGRIPTVSRIKKSALDQFAPFIQQKIDEYPDIKASVLWRMLKDRGYKGSPQSVRYRVAQVRGNRPKKAFLPITVYPGDEAQVDWAHFGTITVGKATRKLSLFLMVLAHSRMIFAKFFFDQTLDSFLSGHVQAFSFFSGVPRRIRYDNLKAAVAERFGQTIRYNPHLLEMAGYYAFKPSACNPYSGNEKGRVERAVRFVRESFFVGSQFATIDKLNAALSAWNADVAAKRVWPDDRQKTVREVFDEEKSALMAQPAHTFSFNLERPVRSGKIPFIRFDKNDYSIPFQLVGQPLSLAADESEVWISREGHEISRHKRSYSGGEKIVDQAHFAGLLDSRPGGEAVAGRSYISQLLPKSEALFSLMVERGVAIGPATSKIFELLRTYGKDVVGSAVEQAISRSFGEPGYVARVCEQLAKKRKDGVPTSLPYDLPEHVPGGKLFVTPHDVATYDDLAKGV